MKYAPRTVYIKERGSYVELSYTEFCRRRNTDQTYMDKLFIPIQGCLLEVVREQYTDFYRDKERWRYLQKLDTSHRLFSLEGFTDSEGNTWDFLVDETVDIAETVVHAEYELYKKIHDGSKSLSSLKKIRYDREHEKDLVQYDITRA